MTEEEYEMCDDCWEQFLPGELSDSDGEKLCEDCYHEYYE